jgi:hypothetical protein
LSAESSARDDVARREVGERVQAGHDRHVVLRAQDRALAAHRLADQERFGLRMVQAGRMELDELHVRERGARAIGHRHPVAGRDVGIARVEIHLAGAARREQRHARLERHHGSLGVEHIGADHALRSGPAELARGEQVDAAVILEQRDVRMRARARQQHALDLATGGVAVMEDAAVRVAALAAEIECRLARCRRLAGDVEVSAELEQRVDHRRAAFDHALDHRGPAQTVARHQRVLDVGRERVVGVLDGGDPALGPVGRGVGRPLLGHDRDRPELGHAQGVEQTRNSASEYEDIAAERVAQRGGPPEDGG